VNRNFSLSEPSGRTQIGEESETGSERPLPHGSIPTNPSAFTEARSRAQQGLLLADALFANAHAFPESEQLDRTVRAQYEDILQQTGESPRLWFSMSPLTKLEIGAYVAAMLDEPDGVRLARAAVGILEQLGLTTAEDIGQVIQMRVPELFAIPLVYPYDDVFVLLKRYLRSTSEMSAGAHSEDSRVLVTCERCGHQWPLATARDWIHYESFVYGGGCPACQAEFRSRATYPGDSA
jgi:hypothetical protein